ncbi:hypothetical protein TD95_000462 [Thielaviopsis punctulata]|uniref:Uncharacterized protein n=1 Tax=Thielaviopsis punctulata TaxID=72032 RepID=A0A0F4ZGV3_9PEZI|nr:hypothetical protein TD95_000462 [Thielaviopsis punctulata]
MSQSYIISRAIDPIFAIFIGVSAAAMRINREGVEQGRTTQQTIQIGLRRMGLSSS